MPLSADNTLFNSIKSPCMVLDIHAPEFKILSANEAYFKVTGTSAEKIVGKPVFEVYPESDDTKRLSGKDILLGSFMKVIETQKPDRIDRLRYDIPLGDEGQFESRYWQVDNIPIFNKAGDFIAILNEVQDVTPITLQAEYLDQLYENTDEGFLTVNKNLTLVGFNKKFKEDYKKVFGRDVEVGKNIIEYAAPERKELVKQVYARVFNGETITADLPFTFPDGVTRTFHFAYKPAKNSFGDITGAFVTLTDITEQKKLEDNRKDVLLNLQERNKDLLCLYQVSSITLTEIDISKMLLKVAQVMPAGFLRPEDTHVRIVYNDLTYSSKDFKETEYKIRTIKKKSRAGSVLIEVFTSNPGQLRMSDVFLKEEEKLIQTISEALVLKIDQQIALSEIEHKSNQLQNVMNSSLDVVCTINAEGEFEMMSETCESLWGYSADELVGKRYMDFVYSEDHDITNIAATEIMRGVSKTNFENRYVHKNGSLVPIVWSARWDEDDQLMYCIARDATEKQAIEQAIKAERERYAEVLMQAPAFICILSGENHVFEMTNPLYLELVDRADIIGKTIYEVFPEVRDQGFFEIIENVYNTGVPFFGNEILVKIKKGPEKILTDVYINISFQAYKGPNNETKGVFVFGIDVTNEVQTRKSIQEINERLEYVNRASYDVIWDWNFESNTIIFGEGLQKYFGYPSKNTKVESTFWYDNVHPEDRNRVETKIHEHFESNAEFWEDEYRFRNSSGAYLFVKDNGIIIRNSEGVPTRMVGAMKDITEKKIAEQRIQALNENLTLQAENLKQINEELEQFAYIASHDLQEPLRMVTSFLAQLERRYNDKLDEKGKQYIYFAVDGAKRMRQIILDLLEYSRAGRLDKHREPTDLNELLENSLKMLGTTINEKSAKIHKEKLPTLSVSPIAIQQVFQNLIGNALKYARDNVKPEVFITAEELESSWRFTISDNGIGVPDEYRDRIFQMFQRLHSRDEYSGTGIGLSICKRIIEQHKGTISVTSNKSGGSDFSFTLAK